MGISRARSAEQGYRADAPRVGSIAGDGSRTLAAIIPGLLADACGKAGSSDQAFALLEEGQTVALRNGERFYEPELCRLKGELLLTGGQDNRRGAELCFQEALRIAKGQDAKALELRAALSLGRLSAKQGRCSEARDLLAPIVDWFTEGLATPDLKEARALLDETDRILATRSPSSLKSIGS